MIRVRALAALAMAMLFAGCALLAPGDSVPPAASFDLLGRVLVSGDGRAFSSNVRWRHAAGDHEIWLMSPVGQTLAHIAADDSGATLTAADQQVYRARTVEGLTRSALGWSLPLIRLQYWIQGLAVPDGPVAEVTRDAQGRPVALAQGGWSIRYAYDEAGAMPPRPRRLDMDSNGQKIRLVIDGWRSGAAQ